MSNQEQLEQLVSSFRPHPAPAHVTLNQASTTPPSLDALLGFPGYNEVALHDLSLAFFQNMVIYHMEDGDRAEFLQFSNSTDLPIELGQNLPQTLKTWIHDVYAPAYIEFMLSQMENKNANWWASLTPAQKAKVLSSWSGSGSMGLSESKEYNDINAIIAVAAMDKLYGSTLAPYRADGTTWGQAALDVLNNPRSLSSLLGQPTDSFNVINKYCNILNYLDSTKNFADDLWFALLSYAISTGKQPPYLDPEGVKGREWLFDVLAKLGNRVLDNDSVLENE